MHQHWSNLSFLSWKVPSEDLQKHTPFPLDLFEGSAYLSIVPFRMSGIRFYNLSPVSSSLTSLWELNLRTYVKVNGVPGIYFFTLDTDHRLAVWIANQFFHLPYRFAKIRSSHQGQIHRFESSRGAFQFEVDQLIHPELKVKTALDRFITERDRLFTKKNEMTWEGRVRHEPWKLHDLTLTRFHQTLTHQVQWMSKLPPDHVVAAEPLTVSFEPFRKIE